MLWHKTANSYIWVWSSLQINDDWNLYLLAFLKVHTLSQPVVVYTFSPSTLGGRDRWISEFKTNLVYWANSRVSKTTQRNFVSKNKMHTLVLSYSEGLTIEPFLFGTKDFFLKPSSLLYPVILTWFWGKSTWNPFQSEGEMLGSRVQRTTFVIPCLLQSIASSVFLLST